MDGAPILFDAHFHLDPGGRCIDAAKDFERAGGSAFMLVSKPYLSRLKNRNDVIEEYELLLSMADRVREETGIRVFTALGVHPARISEMGVKEGIELLKDAVDLAVRYIEEGKACAIGEIGRPHYEVSKEELEASNEVIEYGFERSKDVNCAVIIHSESSERTYEDLSSIADRAGIDKRRVVKHFSPVVRETFGLTPSMIATYENARNACESMKEFMLESDYMDDINRPGAVIGPKTLPKTAKRLLSEGYEEKVWRAMKDLPESVFGIDL